MNKMVLVGILTFLAGAIRPNVTKYFFLENVEDIMGVFSLMVTLDSYSHLLKKEELLLSIYE